MNGTTLASFRAILEEIRSTMIGDVKDKYKTKKDDPSEQMADIADDAAQSYNQQLIMEFGEQEWKKLRLVEEAIEKMDDGQYGVCSECKEPIPEARLKLIPFTAYCVECLEAIEKKNS
jgi:DnaK suppressor protein